MFQGGYPILQIVKKKDWENGNLLVIFSRKGKRVQKEMERNQRLVRDFDRDVSSKLFIFRLVVLIYCCSALRWGSKIF